MEIKTVEEYNEAKKLGRQPLMNLAVVMPIDLRKMLIADEITHSYLSRADNIPAANQRFYKWVWKNKGHFCEESGIELFDFRSEYISHILSRGAFPELAYDPRNTNILTRENHSKWENNLINPGMRIYGKNIMIIEMLLKDYGIKQTPKILMNSYERIKAN